MITIKSISKHSIFIAVVFVVTFFSSCQKDELPEPLSTDSLSTMEIEDIDPSSIEHYDREVVDTQAFASIEMGGRIPVLSESINIASTTETIWLTSREAVRFPAVWLATSAIVHVSDRCGRTKTVYYGQSSVTVDLSNRNTSGGKFYVRSNYKYYAVSIPKDANRATIYRTNTSIYVRFYARITNLVSISANIQHGLAHRYTYINARGQKKNFFISWYHTTPSTFKLDGGRIILESSGVKRTIYVPSNAELAKLVYNRNRGAALYLYKGTIPKPSC